jgi:hypothetical protein
MMLRNAAPFYAFPFFNIQEIMLPASNGKVIPAIPPLPFFSKR